MASKTAQKRRARGRDHDRPGRGVVAGEPPPELEHPLALKCKACGKSGRYHVGSVLLDPTGAPEQEIEDSLSFTGYFRCRACDSPGPWKLAASALARLSAHFLSFMTQEDDAPPFLGGLRTFDGRRIRTCAEGVDRIRELIAHDERNAFLWVRLGNLLDRGGDTDGAFEAFQRAAELDETDIEARHQLGELLVNRGDYEDAAPHLHAVLKHAREFTELRRELRMQLVRDTLELLFHANHRTKGAIDVFPQPQLDNVDRPDDEPLILEIREFDLSSESDWDLLCSSIIGERTFFDESPRRARRRYRDAVAGPAIAERKTARNDPCPCGSGLKFKRCHGGTGKLPERVNV